MGELGSIYADTPADTERGPDLRVTVDVPRVALGEEDGVEVCVPWELERLDGLGSARRVASPFEKGDVVTLRLPHGFPDGGTLKLRGQGSDHEADSAGDLLVTVRLVDGGLSRRDSAELAEPSAMPLGLVVGAGVLAVAVLVWLLVA